MNLPQRLFSDEAAVGIGEGIAAVTKSAFQLFQTDVRLMVLSDHAHLAIGQVRQFAMDLVCPAQLGTALAKEHIVASRCWPV